MANRHLARSVVLQSLFEIDSGAGANESRDDILMKNIQEFAPDQGIFPFMKQLFDLVSAKQVDIDNIIEKAAPEWPLEKIAVVDRNILRIGLAELLFADKEQVPPKVAINEAIELAKEFGGESSGRFVNGVLGAVYRELEDMEESSSSSGLQASAKEVKEEELPREELVGAVVYAREGVDLYVALVHDVFGHWTLSKGKLDEGEDAKDGIVRKVKEEIGLDVEVEAELGENEYIASDPQGGKKTRHAKYFLTKAKFEEITLKKDGGLDDARWFKLIDIVDLNFYDDILPVITRAVNILASHK